MDRSRRDTARDRSALRRASTLRSLLVAIPLALLSGAVLRAQDEPRSDSTGAGPGVRALGADEAPRLLGRRGSVDDGKIVQVELPLGRGRRAIPLGAAVSELAVYEVGEDAFVMMHGGFGGDPLVFHIVDRRSGRSDRLELTDAVRVPEDFRGAPGSVPMLLGDGVFLLVWDQGDGIGFRVRSSTVPVAGAGLTVSLQCAGVESSFDQERRSLGLVFVDRDGATLETFQFRHPVAPIATFSAGPQLDFGKLLVGQSSVRDLLIRNGGDHPLRGVVAIEGPFALGVGLSTRLDLPPGGLTVLSIEWRPRDAGPNLGKLEFLATVPLESRSVELRGEALATREAVLEPGAAVAEVPTAPEPSPIQRLEPPRPDGVVLRWLEPGWIEVLGQLVDPGARVVVVDGDRAGAEGVAVAVDSAGRFRSILPAEVGTTIRVAWPGDLRRTRCGSVGESAFFERGRWTALVRPGDLVRLVERLGDDDGPRFDGRAWIGIADARGRVVFEVGDSSSVDDHRMRLRTALGQWRDLPVVSASHSVR